MKLCSADIPTGFKTRWTFHVVLMPSFCIKMYLYTLLSLRARPQTSSVSSLSTLSPPFLSHSKIWRLKILLASPKTYIPKSSLRIPLAIVTKTFNSSAKYQLIQKKKNINSSSK